jgi:hypothetical protein
MDCGLNFGLRRVWFTSDDPNLSYSVGESLTKGKNRNHGNCNTTTANYNSGVNDKNFLLKFIYLKIFWISSFILFLFVK